MSYLYDITQGVIYQKVMKLLKYYYPDMKLVVKPVSRLVVNNVVYKITSLEHDLKLCAKVYLNNKNVSCRFDTEKKFTNCYFREIHHLEHTRFICLKDDIIYGVSIRNWIEGNSAMEELIGNPERFLDNDVNKIFTLMNMVWEYTEDSEPFQYLNQNEEKIIVTKDRSISSTITKIFNRGDRLLEKRAGMANLLKDLKNLIYVAYQNNKFFETEMSLINSDPSLHEFIFTQDGIVWIDWEYVNCGSKLIDVASFYYSLSNNFWAEKKLKSLFTNYISHVMSNENLNLFGLFFLEKVITCDEATDYKEPIEKLQWGLEESMFFLQQ